MSILMFISEGALCTLKLVALSSPLILLLGIFIGVLRVFASLIVRRILDLYVDVVRGVPLLVLLMIFAYGLPEMGILLDPFTASLLAFSVTGSAYLSEYIKSALLSVDYRFVEAAEALGLGRAYIAFGIILPISLRTALRAASNELVYLVQYSSLASFAGVYEIYAAAKSYASLYFDPLTAMLIIAALYVALGLAVQLSVQALSGFLD